MLNSLKNLFFPKFCLITGKAGRLIHKSAISKFQINEVQRCHVCDRLVQSGFAHESCLEETYLDGLIYFTVYDKNIEKIIEKGKYQDLSDVFLEIGQLLKEFTIKMYNLDEFLISPIPLHSSKLKIRGYNQAEIIADQLGKSTMLINRTRNTKTQVGMSFSEREANLIGAFEPTDLLRANKFKKVLLVDDIYTTGNTMNLCSKVLKENGVEEVVGICFAKSGLRMN